MEQPERSSLYVLIEKQLGQPLAGYVADRRPRLSWRDLATDITEQIGVEVVTYETLRRWFGEDAPRPSASTAA